MSALFRWSSLVYELVSVLEAAPGSDWQNDLNWDDPQTAMDVSRFSRNSVVRRVAHNALSEEFVRDIRKNPETWFESGQIDALQSDFRFYGIRIQPYRAYFRKNRVRGFEEEEDALLEWCYEYQTEFDALFCCYAREAEHILFSNRHYLLALHTSLADFLTSSSGTPGVPSIPIPRVAIPRWVKRAVFFRDHGRCVFCRADLSGIVDLDREEHFDHMVALATGGVNDPTNIQLCCRTCNLRKSTKKASAYMYTAWWSDE
jgi:hypothetical protein